MNKAIRLLAELTATSNAYDKFLTNPNQAKKSVNLIP